MDQRLRQLLALGTEHYVRSEYDKALTCLEPFTEAGPLFPDVLNMLGVSYHHQARFEQARRCFERALEANPRYVETALNLAVTYNDLGLHDQADAVLRRASKHVRADRSDDFVKGKIANMHLQTADAYLEARRVPDAVHELRRALKLRPDFADARVKLAGLLRMRGDLEEARGELKKALQHRPKYAAARVLLGLVEEGLGDGDAAERCWREALDADPSASVAKLYLRMKTQTRVSH